MREALQLQRVMLVVSRVVPGRDQERRGRGDGKHHGQRDSTAAMRRRLGEDRLHGPTIAAHLGICSPQMATRPARAKHRPKSATAATPTPSPPRAGEAAVRRDARRWIYGGLDLVFAIGYAVAIWKVIPNRLPSAMAHLWTFPLATLAMAAGMLLGSPRGWWIAVIGGSVVLVSMFALIVRIVISAAFLAGVYGAFGKAAATFALVMIALTIELVALLPIVQVKYLMTRSGRRALGVQAP